MGLTALCPGTFDPVTNGHLDVVGRAADLFESVVVAVIENPSKAPVFRLEERVALLEEAVRDLPNVRVGSFQGLLVEYARDAGGLGDREGAARGERLRVRDPDGTDERTHR